MSRGVAATIAFMAANANATPRTPPATASTQAFGQELPDQPLACRADRGAHGDLPARATPPGPCSRLAMLMQAMSSSKPTAASTTKSAGRK